MTYRNASGSTLRYVFRGDGHEHDVTQGVSLIHSQCMSPDPIKRDKDGKVEEINTDDMEAEFDFLADKNQRSQIRFAHYVISLPPGEKLTAEQWKKTAKAYMRKMGYGLDTKWTCALHDEKESQHVHIVACRVQNNPQANERAAAREKRGKGNKPQPYPLVDDANDYARGMELMRELEKEFGLIEVVSPEKTWGADLSRDEFEGTINRFEKTGESKAPWKTRIIARISKAVEKSNGKTFTEFLDNLRAVGVDPLVTLNEKGFPTGMSYAMEGRSAAGSKLKSTRLTFSALTGQKFDSKTEEMKPTNKKSEGISYEQTRDIQSCISTSPVSRANNSTPEFGGPRPGFGVGKKKEEIKEESVVTTQRPLQKRLEPLQKRKPGNQTSSKGGVEELLTLQNLLADLQMSATHAKKMARLQWGEDFDR